MSAVSMRTTTVRYQTKPQAAVQYEIALLSGALVYNPNQSEQIKGSLEWRVYKIEGDQRVPMPNKQEGMECYCGYSDTPDNKPNTDTTDNVTFNDGGAAQVAYNSNSTKQFTIIYGSVTGSVFTQLARLDVPVNVIGKDAAVVASIDFDNNNATILYNSITGSYVTESYPVSNISVVEDGVDISETAEIYIKVHKLSAQIKGRGDDISLSGSNSATLTTGKGGIISVTAKSVESTGYVLAKYTDSAGIVHTTKFNVSRSVGRYAVEIITTPTQISYNQTTGIASSSTITATLNVIDIYGNRTTNAPFTRFGAMEWRYVGADWTTYAPDPNSGQSASVLEIKNLDFTKSGVEFRFVDGSDNQLDYETVPFSSVSNGGDAYLVNAASMNIALTLSQISYGTPSGDVPNVIYMTKNNVIVVTGMKYKVPGYDGTIDASHASVEATYNGWVFIYTFSEGKLNTKLKEVKQGAPTSVQLPIEVNDSTDNITRTIYVSYTAIQKGPAGRSYKPNTPELYDPKKEYVWNDEQRDFIYYAFNVNDKGEQDDENGVLSYFQYGVKEYNNNRSVTDPPTAKGGDDNWEYVSEYKSIIVNCLFGTNAVLGGMVFTADTQTSVKETNGEPNIVIDGNSGEFVANKATIRGEVNATAGSFDRCTINNTCRILQTNGNGWFLRGGSDPTADAPNGKPSWWLGYAGDQAGQFTITTYNPSDSSKKSELAIVPQPPSPETFHGRGILDIDSIYQTLASFNQNGGMYVQIGRNIGEGIRFTKNSSNDAFHAFVGEGHGCLNGVIQGYKLNVMSSGQIDISKGNTVYCNGKRTNLVLPTLENCRNVLGTTGAFALDLTIIGASGASDFGVYGKRHNSTTGYTTDCYLLNNDHGDNWFATMSQGDVLTLKLIYTGKSFYAYIVNMQN